MTSPDVNSNRSRGNQTNLPTSHKQQPPITHTSPQPHHLGCATVAQHPSPLLLSSSPVILHQKNGPHQLPPNPHPPNNRHRPPSNLLPSPLQTHPPRDPDRHRIRHNSHAPPIPGLLLAPDPVLPPRHPRHPDRPQSQTDPHDVLDGRSRRGRAALRNPSPRELRLRLSTDRTPYVDPAERKLSIYFLAPTARSWPFIAESGEGPPHRGVSAICGRRS